MSESVIDCSIIDDHLHSDHLPVMLSLDFNINHSVVSKRPHVVKKAWHKANDCHIDMYKSKLNEQLSDIFVTNELMLCNNVNCTVHNHDICDLYHRLIHACLKAGECIPSTAPPNKTIYRDGMTLLKHIRGKPFHSIGSGKLKINLTLVMWLE